MELKVAEATRAKACILELVNNVRKACSELQSAMTAAKKEAHEEEEKNEVAAVKLPSQHEILIFTEDKTNGII